MWGYKSFTPQGEPGVVSSLQIVGHRVGDAVYDKTVSQLLLPILRLFFFLFLICLMGRSSSSSFLVTFGENCSIGNCRFSVSIGGDEFKILLCCRLVLELLAPGLLSFSS